MSLRLATYNVHRCIGRDGRFDPARTLGVLRELDADVIALQELSWTSGAARQVLAQFSEALGTTALAGPTLLREDGHYGNALLSRLPVRSVERVDLSFRNREPRGALDVELDAGDVPLRVVATHLGLRPAERRAQLQQLLLRLESHAGATRVLMGDLNEWLLWGRPLRWLRRHFGSTPAPATFPASLPLLALDRIWVEPRQCLIALRAHVSEQARLASDHLPLVAELNLA